ncbi:MAG: serine hydrolase domain-containing protein [Candidatus Aminicenantes bacterium]|nr:serine hydrolase domain-containing protein [Candidatus Aminicenantes bacterium]
MPIRRKGLAIGALLAAMISAGAPAVPQERAAAAELSVAAKVDRVFERWSRSDTPGCAVGVAVNGQPVLIRAYGMANLEYGLRIRPDTIFESGSVAKQFTAAAIALLVQDGKLSLDDPVRKHIPELPDFGTPILIRHFLNHTSGLRSQWPLLSLAGRPPGLAVHSNDEILELVGRMKELNFKPGDEFLYNNTGYTLLGVVVQRVSGKSLAEFSRERLFTPLGMTRTQWRDDFTKIVPDRATAYRQERDGTFRTYMPFTNVQGNGGLLTTVGDLLIWNGNFDAPRIGGQALVEQLQTRGRLNDGFENEYAQGLVVTSYKGLREVSHGGSTAGYQTFLARFPDERLSIAVLSNVTSSGPARLAHEVADLFLAGKLKEPAKPAPAAVPAEALRKFVGVYREPLTDAAMRAGLDKEGKALLIAGQAVVAVSENTFVSADGGRQAVFEAGSGSVLLRMRESDGRSKPRLWEAMPPFAPKPEELAAFAGTYYSDEIDTTYDLFVEGGALKVRFRPAMRFTLAPIYEDAFEGDENVLRFTRGPSGGVTGFLVYAGRVRHLRFTKR